MALNPEGAVVFKELLFLISQKKDQNLLCLIFLFLTNTSLKNFTSSEEKEEFKVYSKKLLLKFFFPLEGR